MSSSIMVILCPSRGLGYFALREAEDGSIRFLTVPSVGIDETETATLALSQYFDLNDEDMRIIGVRHLGKLVSGDMDFSVNAVIVSEKFKDVEPTGIRWVSEGGLSGLVHNGYINSTESVAAHGLFNLHRAEFGSLLHGLF